jgi:hypothetical protein
MLTSSCPASASHTFTFPSKLCRQRAYSAWTASKGLVSHTKAEVLYLAPRSLRLSHMGGTYILLDYLCWGRSTRRPLRTCHHTFPHTILVRIRPTCACACRDITKLLTAVSHRTALHQGPVGVVFAPPLAVFAYFTSSLAPACTTELPQLQLQLQARTLPSSPLLSTSTTLHSSPSPSSPSPSSSPHHISCMATRPCRMLRSG